MPKVDSTLNVKISKKQREQFKRKCKAQGVTIEKAVPILLQKVINGDIGFTPVQTKLVMNTRRT